MKLSEANAWFRRNRDKLGQDDPVSEMIARNGIEPRYVLEIGCANGWRLAYLCKKYDCRAVGLDASPDAIDDGRRRFAAMDMNLWTHVFPDFTFSASFDVVICGFFLYLAERNNLFDIVARIDRLLADNGYLIIHDFYSERPYSNPYAHDPDMRSYKQDYSKLFTGNPTYQLVCGQLDGVGDDCVAVHLLRKRVSI